MLLRPWIILSSWIDDSRLFLTLWPASFRLYLTEVVASFSWQFELPWAAYHSSDANGHPWLFHVFFLYPIIHLWQLHTSTTLDRKSFLHRRQSFISDSSVRFFLAEPISSGSFFFLAIWTSFSILPFQRRTWPSLTLSTSAYTWVGHRALFSIWILYWLEVPVNLFWRFHLPCLPVSTSILNPFHVLSF